MDDLLHCLDNADKSTVKLFFITRKKNQTTKEITYRVLKSRIRFEIAEELKNCAHRQISAIQDHDYEQIQYGVISHSDRTVVETIPHEDVPYLSDMLSEIARPPDENILAEEDFSHIWGYIVRIECQNSTLFLFRKYTPKKLLEKGKLACIIRRDQFEKLDDQIITLDSSYDAALLLKAQDPSRPAQQQPDMLIFCRSWFESFFSFVDVYRHEVEDNQAYLDEKGILENAAQMVQTCCSDSRAIKKLARILHNRQLDSLDLPKIRTVIRDYNLPVSLNHEGKLQVSQEHIWVILRILDDDYVKSEITDTKYEARSKVRK